MKRTSYEAPHYAVFSSLPPLPPYLDETFSSPPYCQASSSLIVRDQTSHPYKAVGSLIYPIHS